MRPWGTTGKRSGCKRGSSNFPEKQGSRIGVISVTFVIPRDTARRPNLLIGGRWRQRKKVYNRWHDEDCKRDEQVWWALFGILASVPAFRTRQSSRGGRN